MIAWLTGLAWASDEAVGTSLVATPPAEAAEARLPDRSGPPPVLAAEILAYPAPEVHRLSDAVEVHHVRVEGVRKVEIEATLLRGRLDLDPTPTHSTAAVGGLGDLATSSMDAGELEIYTDLHELELTSSLSLQVGGYTLSAPKDELASAWSPFREMLRSPVYPKDDVARHVRESLHYYTAEGPNDAGQAAWAALTYAWFPADHPYGSRPDLAELARIDARVLAEQQARWVKISPIRVLVVGDVAYEEVEPALREAFDGLGTPGDRPKPLEVAPPTASRVIAVDMPGNAQVTLMLRTAGPKQEDPDRLVAMLADFALGGHFQSRLNKNLREEKGYTYGVGSSLLMALDRGHWTVSTAVAGEHAAASIREIEKELASLCSGGVSAEELHLARETLVADWNTHLETASSASSFYEWLYLSRLDLGDEAALLARIPEVSAEETAAVASKYLAPEKVRVWVVAGDRKNLEPQLTELGWTPEWISGEQAILGTF